MMSALSSECSARRRAGHPGLAALLLVLAAPAAASAQLSSSSPPSPASTLRLSMNDAVSMALEASLGLKQEHLAVDIAEQDVVSARAAFGPLTSYGVSRNTSQAPLQRFEDGTTAVGSSASLNASGAFSQRLPWLGSSYAIQWNGSRNSTGGDANSTFNPRLGSTLQASFTQPLWRNLRIDPPRAALDRSERSRGIADVQLQQRVVMTEASVRSAYLGLVAAIEGRKVAQENMDLAQQSLQNSRARVAVGQAPPIDIVTAEASVEGNREQLILADAGVASAEDGLRAQIFDPDRPDYWTVHLEPSDTIQLTPRDINVDEIIQAALANRLDLRVLKQSAAITALNLDLDRNLTKPAIDLTVNYAATGSGGTQLIGGLPSVRTFGAVLDDAFTGVYPSWTVGVNVGYPLGRTSARAAATQAELTGQQQQLALRQLELQIVGQVRQAARDVQTSFERVQATQAARSASERQLDAEQRRFAVGLSDTFQLQARQSQLAAARVSELNAVIAYNNALIELDRVQKVP
jgi:outer membrane protein